MQGSPKRQTPAPSMLFLAALTLALSTPKWPGSARASSDIEEQGGLQGPAHPN